MFSRSSPQPLDSRQYGSDSGHYGTQTTSTGAPVIPAITTAESIEVAAISSGATAVSDTNTDCAPGDGTDNTIPSKRSSKIWSSLSSLSRMLRKPSQQSNSSDHHGKPVPGMQDNKVEQLSESLQYDRQQQDLEQQDGSQQRDQSFDQQQEQPAAVPSSGSPRRWSLTQRDGGNCTNNNSDTINNTDNTGNATYLFPHTRRPFRLSSWSASPKHMRSRSRDSADTATSRSSMGNSAPMSPLRAELIPTGPILLPEISSGPPISLIDIPFSQDTVDKADPAVYRKLHHRTLSNDTLDSSDPSSDPSSDSSYPSALAQSNHLRHKMSNAMHSDISTVSLAPTNCAFDRDDRHTILRYMGYNNYNPTNANIS
ncbi:hypothetical protein BASA81_016310 [Batrachochytrium salamandrivorans]|nr:hypothetical protein BASA81_016310 [Batrachochytrium salamandrivorans]